ncbi:MAG: LTA synthase family protein [Gammaproteobacteria bacterium]|nr:LTA synthase family protein [Gammaproteobacteria bacterium]
MSKNNNSPLAYLLQLIKIWWPVWLWISGLYAITQFVTWYFFGLTVWHDVWIRDGFIHVLFGGLLFNLCRGFWPWAAAYTLLITILQISNAIKYSVLGSPIMPDDFIGFVNMFMLFDDWRLWAMWAALLIPVLLWVYAIDWRKPLTWAVLSGIVLTGFGFVQYAVPINRYMDENLGDRIWDQPGNYRDRGLIQHVLQETSRNLARGHIELSADDVRTARQALLGRQEIARQPTALDNRNVHIILLESFWDPMVLEDAGISEDPLDPRFRALWRQTGNSTALAPVYGGYTANSEFEVLCGFPVTHNAVFFEGWLRNDVPCLPDYLGGAGYHTVVSHPNFASFWNRVNSYRRIGFEDYWAIQDFELDDMNKTFLSDVSLYRQVWDKQQLMRDSGKPLLNYIVTYFGHLDYPLNDARPQKITVENDPNLVERYVNTMYYKSRELMDFYEKLRAEDPDAVVVIFGDHLPYLGPNFDGYVESGILKRSKGDFNAGMFVNFSKTPLIIIDGQNGPLERHELPMFRIPGLIAGLLGDKNTSLLSVVTYPENYNVRPLPGITLSRGQGGEDTAPFTCIDGAREARCSVIGPWVDNVKILTTDIFSGNQQALAQ